MPYKPLAELNQLPDSSAFELSRERLNAARVGLEKREREYRYKITTECLRAIGYASEAGSAPGAAEAYLDDALRCLQDAKQYAILLGELPL